MDDLRQDLRMAFRRLRDAPGFTAAAVLTIALGVGMNAAVFSVVRAVLLKPLPFPQSDRLYMVYSANRTAGRLNATVSPVDLDDWRARRQAIQDLGGYFYAEGSSGLDWTGRGDPKRLSTVFVTPGFFSTLGVLPVNGRLPREDEMVRGGPDRVAVLTHAFWQREFGGTPVQSGATGVTMTLNGEPYEVIGVLPSDLRFPTDAADIFVPVFDDSGYRHPAPAPGPHLERGRTRTRRDRTGRRTGGDGAHHAAAGRRVPRQPRLGRRDGRSLARCCGRPGPRRIAGALRGGRTRPADGLRQRRRAAAVTGGGPEPRDGGASRVGRQARTPDTPAADGERGARDDWRRSRTGARAVDGQRLRGAQRR